MSDSICGIDCSKCEFKDNCGGCAKTKGHPFGRECVVATCCLKKGYAECHKCSGKSCELKEQLITEFNELGIKDMETVTSLNELKGSFANIEYILPNAQTVKLLDDNKIYLGNQICKTGSDRCFGIIADESYLTVSEYDQDGTNAEIIIHKKRNA